MDLHPAVNPNFQCVRPGCGTMLLPDGTCPRCSPPMLRPTEEKAAIAEYFRDKKLARVAENEMAFQQQQAPRPLPPQDRPPAPWQSTPELDAAEQDHAIEEEIARRVDAELARRDASIEAQIAKRVDAELAKRNPPPADKT